jgi:hypothetical protein
MARSSASARVLTDHDEIRQWAEQRDAQPACVQGTGGRGDVGMIRLDFPGYSGEGSLNPISWDDWLSKFDESNLALLVQDETADGETSNFNKLVNRDNAKSSSRGRRKNSASSSRPQARTRQQSRSTAQKSQNQRSQKRKTAGASDGRKSRKSTSSRTTRSKNSGSTPRGRSTGRTGKSTAVRGSSTKRGTSSTGSRRSGRKAA